VKGGIHRRNTAHNTSFVFKSDKPDAFEERKFTRMSVSRHRNESDLIKFMNDIQSTTLSAKRKETI